MTTIAAMAAWSHDPIDHRSIGTGPIVPEICLVTAVRRNPVASKFVACFRIKQLLSSRLLALISCSKSRVLGKIKGVGSEFVAFDYNGADTFKCFMMAIICRPEYSPERCVKLVLLRSAISVVPARSVERPTRWQPQREMECVRPVCRSSEGPPCSRRP